MLSFIIKNDNKQKLFYKDGEGYVSPGEVRNMKKMKKIKAVIFDMDNTLIDRRKAFLIMCDYFIDKYSSKHPFEGKTEDLVKYMVEIDADGYGGLCNFIPKLNRLWKLPLTVEDFIRERNELFGSLAILYSETIEVLEELKKKYKLGMVTNGFSSVQRKKIETVRIEKYFEDIIVSEEVDFEKPDPRVFLLSCERLGVKPEEAVYIGDYYINDIAGALSANIMPIWINENPDEHKEYTGLRVKCLRDILQLL